MNTTVRYTCFGPFSQGRCSFDYLRDIVVIVSSLFSMLLLVVAVGTKVDYYGIGTQNRSFSARSQGFSPEDSLKCPLLSQNEPLVMF